MGRNKPGDRPIVDDSSNNTLYGNNFLSFPNPPFDSGSNQWTHLDAGNYWADYAGSDADSDGIGDTPYAIGPSGADPHPRVAPVDTGTIAQPAVVDADPPSPGPRFDDGITDQRVIENQTLYLGNLNVHPGGHLTLRNVHLITGGFSACSNLGVDGGGTLVIEGCTLTQMACGNGFQLQPADGSTLQIRDTNLSVSGHEWPYGGLQIHDAGVSIEDSILSDTIVSFFGTNTGVISGTTILRSFWAVSMENASNITVENNTVDRNIDSPIRCTGSDNTIRGNKIRGTWGEGDRHLGGTGNTIEDNTVIDTNRNIRGISHGESGAVIRNNRVANAAIGIATGNGGQIIENNEIVECITGIELGWNNTTVRNNTVAGCDTGILVTGAGQTVSENTLQGCTVGVNAMGTGFLFYRNSFMGNGVHAVNGRSQRLGQRARHRRQLLERP